MRIVNLLEMSACINQICQWHFDEWGKFYPLCLKFKEEKYIMKSIIVFCLGVISLFYLLNIGVGVIELIPDNIPFVGNLDEGGATIFSRTKSRIFRAAGTLVP